ncbi:MAG TPA: Na+/H+ antiporter NhaA [Steroidobacteraceae bacterium]|nr:Na+/H+ antiporter NhaA [Steroidobacteraceae bacterium]
MARPIHAGSSASLLQRLLRGESTGGVLLMAAALLAVTAANSPLAPAYFGALRFHAGSLSVLEWINDGLMALFFLMVGLEIKREMLIGRLGDWPRRLQPGVAAAGGMLAPALVYLIFNRHDATALHGWAIPSATDIAFALGVISLLGPRVPPSLKVFLAALAIIDDLGAVIIIAVFYTNGLSAAHLLGAAAVTGALITLNRLRVHTLAPYLALGAVLWALLLESGIHATIAGVVLALTIPLGSPALPGAGGAGPNDEPGAGRTAGADAGVDAGAGSPLARLERALHAPVTFLIVPLFGFANAGVSFAGLTPGVLLEPLMLGVAVGLVLGKFVGVAGSLLLLVRSGLGRLPAGASWPQVLGVSLLCGIGFTMSLFIGLLAFDDPQLQDHVRIAVLAGSVVAGCAGTLVLRLAR